tara:strand:+ start:2781 stop:3113 length:333 start_codon:yes stop_codon:yes gene_type:complete
MARWENEDVSGLNLPDPQSTEKKFYGTRGVETEEKNAFASVSNTGKSAFYYVLYDRSEVVDAYNDRLTRSSSQTRNLRKVSKNCFDFYMKYLKTKNTLYLTRARRTMMEK